MGNDANTSYSNARVAIHAITWMQTSFVVVSGVNMMEIR